uniref:LY6/PLAUR domain containing 6 n=1 Tax=Ficedula albicollis TaxID=59894 RepID=A0A803W7E8_FICAL
IHNIPIYQQGQGRELRLGLSPKGCCRCTQQELSLLPGLGFAGKLRKSFVEASKLGWIWDDDIKYPSCCSIATPYPRGFKCFTCEKASDNYECNRWAPDVYCPRGTRYCFSQHMMKASGESVSVTKRCVALEECLSTGCTYIKHEEYKVCTSCCEGTICNLPLPRNASDAVFSTLSPLSATAPLSPALGTPLGAGLALLAQRWLTATATGQ